MNKKNPTSKIPKPKTLVNGLYPEEAAAEAAVRKAQKDYLEMQRIPDVWEKEQLEKYRERSLKGKNIPEFGEYRVFFTRATLLNDYAGLNYKEKWLREVMELFRNKKSNIAYPPFSQLKNLTGMSKNTLIRTIQSLEAKKVFKVERRAGENNVYLFPEIKII